jgi:hypothetical protein
MSANNVAYPTESIPSRMRYFLMFPLLMSLMFIWANYIYGNIMLFMSLDPSSVIVTPGGQIYRITKVVPTTIPPK